MNLKDIKKSFIVILSIFLASIIRIDGINEPYIWPSIALVAAFAFAWGEGIWPSIFTGIFFAESFNLFWAKNSPIQGLLGNVFFELMFFPVIVTLAFLVVARIKRAMRKENINFTEMKDLLAFFSFITIFTFVLSLFIYGVFYQRDATKAIGFFLMESANILMLTPLLYLLITGKFFISIRANKNSQMKMGIYLLLIIAVTALTLGPVSRMLELDIDVVIVIPMMIVAITLGQTANALQMAIVWLIGLRGVEYSDTWNTISAVSPINFGIFMISIGTIIIWVTSISENLKKRSLYLEIQNEMLVENEEKIKNSEKRLDVIFRSSPIMIVLANLKTETIADCNEQTMKDLGFSRDEMIGMNAFDFGIWESTEEKNSYVEILKRYGRVSDYEMRIKQKNGEERIFTGTTEPIEIDSQEFALIALIDITEKKKTQMRIEKFNEELEGTVKQRTQDLKDAKEFNDKVLKNSPMGILTYNSYGDCVMVNEMATKITGQTVEELHSYNYLTGGIWETFGLRKLVDHTLATGEDGVMEANLTSIKGINSWQEFRTTKFYINDEAFLLLMSSDISARKEADQALKNAETQLRNMTNNLPLVVFQGKYINGEFEYIFINDICYEMLGISRDREISGQRVFNAMMDEDREDISNLFAEAALKNVSWKGDFRVIVNEKMRWIHCESMPVENESGEILWNGYLQDTTERREAEEDVNLFFKTSIDLMSISDVDGQFKRLSPSWEDILGWTEEELRGKALSEFVHPDDMENLLFEQSKLKQGGTVISFIGRFRCRDGSFRWLAWNSHNQLERGVILSVARDITEIKKVEQVLIEAKNAAESADRAKSEFLANMSHEIRTPLNAVIGFSEILGSQATDQKQKVYLDSINTAGKSLLRLINDILDLSKIEAGMMGVNYGPVNIRNIFKEIEEIFKMEVDVKGIQFIVDVDETIPKVLILDESRVRQVLLNLVGNAVKFTDSGYIKLKVVKRSIDPEGKRIDLIMAVQDTGIGINKEELTEVFDSFRQQYGQSDRKYGGTGLGLSISKRLVELMNGRIELESEQGAGSTFTIYLRDISVASFERIEHPETLMEKVKFSGEKVLVVDDVESNRELVKEQLTMVGLKVYTAANGEDAIYKTQNIKPSLILMDLMMPIMDGHEATAQIKGDESISHIPIIALTASTRIRSFQEDETSPFDGYLSKPVSARQLYKEVQRFIIPIAENKGIEESQNGIKREDESFAAPESYILLGTKDTEKLRESIGVSLSDLNKGLRRSLAIQFAKQLHSVGEEISNEWIVQQAELLKVALNNTDIETATRIIRELYDQVYSIK